MLLLIDNYDSFTHNLARYFIELGQDVEVIRNDHISCEDIQRLSPHYLVFSPGPGRPENAGVTLNAIRQFAGKIPMFGVCLGHQAIGQAFGAKVIQAENIRHGKTSNVTHNNSWMFKKVGNPFVATRYHSLLIENTSLPDCFDVTAWCETDSSQREIMAMMHNQLPISGVQFHPESLLTEAGHQILENFLTHNVGDSN